MLGSSYAQRGSLTVWLSLVALKSWTPRKNGRRGGQKRYSNSVIALALQLRLVFKLPRRQTEDLLRSLFVPMDIDLDVPDRSTLSRRSRDLRIKATARPSSRSIHLIIDVTELKDFGRGEWARAKHGSQGTHVGWRELHLGIDSKGFIVTADLIDSTAADATAFPPLIRKLKGPIKKATTNGGYDHRKVWELLDELPALGVIPLHRRARPGDEPSAKIRNRHLRRLKKVGRAQRRRDSGQTKQAKVENAIGRFKRILGPSLRARRRGGQQVEAMMGVAILNRMLELGAPRSVRIPS